MALWCLGSCNRLLLLLPPSWRLHSQGHLRQCADSLAGELAPCWWQWFCNCWACLWTCRVWCFFSSCSRGGHSTVRMRAARLVTHRGGPSKWAGLFAGLLHAQS